MIKSGSGCVIVTPQNSQHIQYRSGKHTHGALMCVFLLTSASLRLYLTVVTTFRFSPRFKVQGSRFTIILYCISQVTMKFLLECIFTPVPTTPGIGIGGTAWSYLTLYNAMLPHSWQHYCMLINKKHKTHKILCVYKMS